MGNMNTPTIERIETTIFRLPMKGVLQWGKSSRIAELRHVLVRVLLSSGAEGYAEAPPRPTIYGETASSICSIIQEELAPRIVAMPALSASTEDVPVDAAFLSIQQSLHEIKNNYAAKGAIDIALHAAVSQHLGVSLSERIGATRSRIRVSYILGIGERDTVLEEAAGVVEQGVRVLKVKVGRDWDDDIRRIIELQELLGPDVDLYADANETMQPEGAASHLAQLSEMGLLYCEEPLPVEQMKERTALQSGGHLPIIADDSTFSLRDQEREIAASTYDILNIKTARTGFTESHLMLAANQKAGKGCMVGSQASAGLGTAMAAIFAALPGVDHPSELSFPLKLEADIVNQAIPVEDGYIQLADASAVAIDPDLLSNAVV
jgi:L-alanine-DL-glutamate epimerase-like enolase superfamily enzyme